MTHKTVKPPADISETRRISIEQALALGHRPQFIAASLHVPLRQVHRIAAWLDELNAEPPVVPTPRKPVNA